MKRAGRLKEVLLSDENITAALQPGAIEEAVRSATSRLDYNIKNHLEKVLK